MALPILSNITPPETGVFDRFWATSINITRGARLIVTLVPYDGTHILLEPVKRLHVQDISTDAGLQQLVTDAYTLVQNKAEKLTLPFLVSISAPSPSRSVQTTGLFTSDNPQKPDIFTIPDILTLAENDVNVAQVIGGLLTWIAANTHLAK